jgi:hypothetical protein
VYLWHEGEWIDITDAFQNDKELLQAKNVSVEAPASSTAEEEIPFCDGECDACGYTDDEDNWEDGWTPFWGVPDVARIIFNPPATIVFWDDGTKTVVKCMEGEKFERYAGFAAACMKKMFGSTTRAKAVMDESDMANWGEPKSKAESDATNIKQTRKEITVKELVDAFVGALKCTAEKQEEKKDATPAE